MPPPTPGVGNNALGGITVTVGTGTGVGEARCIRVGVDAAAQAALLAITRGSRGMYNIAEDDGSVSIDKARNELGFDPEFRVIGPNFPRL